MKKALINLASRKTWIYKLALALLANRMVHSSNLLRPKHLEALGWIKEDDCYVKTGIKHRDKVWIEFEHHYFIVWHGKDKTFVALECTLEWFETYMVLLDHDHQRYNLANI